MPVLIVYPPLTPGCLMCAEQLHFDTCIYVHSVSMCDTEIHARGIADKDRRCMKHQTKKIHVSPMSGCSSFGFVFPLEHEPKCEMTPKLCLELIKTSFCPYLKGKEKQLQFH